MRRRFRRRQREVDMFGEMDANLNLVPMLDVIFNLLFFFIMASEVRQHSRFLDIRLPSSSTAATTETKPVVPEIALAKDGMMYLDGSPVNAQELEARLKDIVATKKIEEVILSCDGEIAWQRIVTATDICRAAGMLQVTPRMETAPPGTAGSTAQ